MVAVLRDCVVAATGAPVVCRGTGIIWWFSLEDEPCLTGPVSQHFDSVGEPLALCSVPLTSIAELLVWLRLMASEEEQSNLKTKAS